MSKITNVLFVSAVAMTLAACSSAPAKVAEKAPECSFPGTDKAAPLWVCDAPVEGMTVGAVGTAAKSDAGIAFMKQMAATEARVQLAQNMKVQVQNMIKQYAETTGAGSKETVDRVNTSVTKQITDQTLQGTKILRSIVAPDGTMYVLVGLDEASAQKLTEVAIKTSMNNDQAVWQQFKAQKGQDELAADIAKQRAAAGK
jgi:Ni,Fe-hydrogenase III component G